MRQETNRSLVELLLCAADLAGMGYEFALTAAVEWLGMEFTNTALDASYEARAIAKHKTPSIADYLEAAYRVVEGRGLGNAG